MCGVWEGGRCCGKENSRGNWEQWGMRMEGWLLSSPHLPMGGCMRGKRSSLSLTFPSLSSKFCLVVIDPLLYFPPLLKKVLFLFIFRERVREGEREGEKHLLIASHRSPTGDMACNPGMCPDWESNWWPFSLQASAQSTEPHQPGQIPLFNGKSIKCSSVLRTGAKVSAIDWYLSGMLACVTFGRLTSLCFDFPLYKTYLPHRVVERTKHA